MRAWAASLYCRNLPHCRQNSALEMGSISWRRAHSNGASANINAPAAISDVATRQRPQPGRSSSAIDGYFDRRASKVVVMFFSFFSSDELNVAGFFFKKKVETVQELN